jgi:hypothetical protein
VATAIPAALVADRDMVALLPPGLVEPATKVLRIAGDGPYGLFGPDLFGDPEARALPYPVVGTPSERNGGAFDLAWAAYDPSEIWTMTSIGSLCAGPIAAYWAVTRGRGWDWVFNGGTARYTRVYRNPTPPGTVGYGFLIVDAVDTGNEGVTPGILRRSDIAFADHECPIQASESWRPPTAIPPSLAIPEDNLTRWRDLLGLDAVYLAANHMSDRGVAGIQSTLQLLDEYGFPGTGLGMNLDQALEPAYLSVAGLRIGFVAWNNVGGVARADADTAGVAWLTEANVTEAVRRARAGGADLVICDPQWWGGAEYHNDLRGSQFTEITWFDNAGCDHVIGAGTHVAGPLLLRTEPDDASLVLGSPGNYVFGQPWWQEVQEGVILEMSFRGTELVNVRFHPYVIVDSVRPALIDPVTDGRYVLERIWSGASLDLD